MRTSSRLALAAVVGLAVLCGSPAARAQDVSGDYTTFYQQLGPYGAWEQDGTYGSVFYPSVAAGWRPYLYGQWVMTEYGWTWVSQEPFGWATFHYGRWWWNPWRSAWAWVPGYEWAPAWVTWRYSGDAIGWGPLYVGYDRWGDGYPVYYDHWTYVPCEHFYGGPVSSYAYPVSYVQQNYYRGSPVRGDIGRPGYGPPQQLVQSHSHVAVHPIAISHTANPSLVSGKSFSGGSLVMYKPPHLPIYNPANRPPPEVRGAGAQGLGGARNIPRLPGRTGQVPTPRPTEAHPPEQGHPAANHGPQQYHPPVVRPTQPGRPEPHPTPQPHPAPPARIVARPSPAPAPPKAPAPARQYSPWTNHVNPAVPSNAAHRTFAPPPRRK